MTIQLPHIGTPHVWKGPAGAVEIRSLSPSVMLFIYTGRVSGDVVKFFEPIVAKLMAKGIRPQMFVDAIEMTGYEASFRPEIERWTLTVPECYPIHIWFRSKILAMCIAVVCLVTGSKSVKPYDERAKFEAAIRAAIAADRAVA